MKFLVYFGFILSIYLLNYFFLSQMNQLCKVCGEPAAGFHFGAFTCEGCKSFFGRTYNNIAAIAGCKNNGDCVINKKNRTACKACRLRKCLLVGMSKSGSRYGRRSNWFKIHCLLQEQHTSGSSASSGASSGGGGGGSTNPTNANSLEQLARLHQIHARQTYQDKTNPCIKSAVNVSNIAAAAAAAALNIPGNSCATSTTATDLTNFLNASAKFVNGNADNPVNASEMPKSRLSDTPSDSGASSAGDPTDECTSNTSTRPPLLLHSERNCNSAHQALELSTNGDEACDGDERERKRQQFLQIFRSHSEPLRSPFVSFALSLPPPLLAGTPPTYLQPAYKIEKNSTKPEGIQDEPIDLSIKSKLNEDQISSMKTSETVIKAEGVISKATTPLDLTLVRTTPTLTG
ncbi:eagle isoform 1-T1 [Glossina fuscipes fuscipes]